jgi:hypothetical protein
MNEQIKQLWVQAAKTTQGDSWEEQTKFMEQFAELIVRECAEFARQHNLEKADRSHMIHKAIKQHFGVE